MQAIFWLILGCLGSLWPVWAGAADKVPVRAGEVSIDPALQLDERLERWGPRGVELHGMGFLSWRGGTSNMRTGLNLLMAQLDARYRYANVGLFVTPRLMVAPLGTDNDHGEVALRQLYSYAQHPWGEVKVGKIYERFARQFDYGMYGSLVANYGMTTQADLGVSFEGTPRLGLPGWRMDYALQYFGIDGQAWNIQNSDLFAARYVTKQNIVVSRLAPVYQFNTNHTLSAGLNAQRFAVKLQPPQAATQPLQRLALDVDYNLGPFNAFLEIGHQFGTDYVFRDASLLSDNTFVWGGVMYTRQAWNVRYHLNTMAFAQGTVEVMHQPGLSYRCSDNFTLLAEAVLWSTSDFTVGDAQGYRERSVYLIAKGEF